MKKTFGILLFFALWLLLSLKTIAHPYEPTVLILSPNKTSADKKLQNEIQKYNTQLRLKAQELADQNEEEVNDSDKQAENIRIMERKKVTFSKNIDFYKEISLIAEGYLQYRFFERFNNLLIYAVDEKSDSSITSLASLANKYEMQYVLNFPKVVSFLENKSKKTTITVELYDNKSKKVVLYKDFTGHDANPGFEFACTDKSIECTVSNSLSEALGEIISVIAANNPTIIQNRILAQERTQALLSYYYTKAHEKEILDIIKLSDTSISTEGFYSGLMNDSATKFISFFALKNQVDSFQKLRDQDDNVKIILENTNDIDNIPGIYAYIVIGLYYERKWYVKKEQVTCFNADNLESGRKKFFTNLQNWNFFKENSTDFNPDFWNTNFFDKVPDLTKDKNWPKYKESWKTEEENNRPYVGMYNIVADYLRGEYDKQSKDFINSMSKQVLLPFMEQLKIDSSQDVKDFALLNNDTFTLIFPKDMSIALNPIQVVTTKGQRVLRYFLIFPTTKNVYEWTYFKPLVLTSKSWHYGSDIIEQLSVLTDWNFALDYLEDKNFWDNYVLKKENAEYVYLKKLK